MTSVCNFLLACVANLEEAPAVCDFLVLDCSGKSYLAKMLRDLEVENGGDAPRIHSMDDYFMTEVEK
ncbi:P-loop containing nucleoside triphosphate hydrolases superfamily protein, partial [Trifolium medium]|nr:P-loop containing nucleoside triphosphate hydrolases superfamily protein [Trifolium medium]